jgi:DNA-binding GntR family transcriptional regulator
VPGNLGTTRAMPIQKASASQQIANELRAQIEAGEFKPGQALPSDTELAARFEVSKPTITKARAMLVALGLVASRAGAASTVRDPVSANRHLQRARRTGRIYPEGGYARILRAGLAPAAADVAAALGAAAGSSLIERRRVTYAADDTPLATSTTYFPADLADQCPALLETERITQGTTLYVEQQTGRSAASIAATAACRPGGSEPADDVQQLRLAPGTCLLALSTTTYDTEGAAISHEIELHPPATAITLDITGL